MPAFDVAHFKEQGQDVIVVFVGRSFAQKTDAQQKELWAALQEGASNAGLAGMVVPVWEAAGHRMGFLAPKQWHPSFKSVTLADLARNINRKLTCG